MASLAQMNAVGNLTRDGETGYTPNGAMKVTFTIAVNKRRKEDGANFFRVTAWGRLAEALDKLAQQGALTKGSQVFVTGAFEAREYTANDGAARMSLDINAAEVLLLGSRGDRAQPQDLGDDQPPF